eukprot:1161799-Pelagomonas_calceolata.AAC.7
MLVARESNIGNRALPAPAAADSNWDGGVGKGRPCCFIRFVAGVMGRGTAKGVRWSRETG